ncbi:N-alpha-acetyltransferase 60 [Brevipalpus obovatus]|uniref:N-alpha-acetyltransferase 60 n=1 Tax=Brevipalpus obovatus TaxID=246614 RepID=UPI003D9EABBD
MSVCVNLESELIEEKHLRDQLISSSNDDINSLHNGDIQLRRLCPADLQNLQQLCKEWFPIEYPHRWYELVTNGQYFYPVAATFNGQIIGVIVADLVFRWCCDDCDMDMWISSRFSLESPMIYILALGVVKEWRRMGIGTLLLDKLITEIDHRLDNTRLQESVGAIFLHVQCSNKSAIKFYEKKNFKVHRYLPCYYLLDHNHCDAYSYVLYLKNSFPSWKYSHTFCSPLITRSLIPDLNNCSQHAKRIISKWKRTLLLVTSSLVVYFDSFRDLIGLRPQCVELSSSYPRREFRTKITHM